MYCLKRCVTSLRLSLQEEVDLLRVQTAQDDATIHELRVALQGQKEGTPSL